MGYAIVAFLDHDNPESDEAYDNDYLFRGEYKGWPKAVNGLMNFAVREMKAPLCVTAGIDMEPDPNINAALMLTDFRAKFPDLCGVMQPTGDRMGMDKEGKVAAERICGSPFIGAGYVLRANRGKGPIWHEYWHYFSDEELKCVVEAQGLLWQRPDLTHFHHHFTRYKRPRPPHLHKARGKWDDDKALFNARMRAGFPRSELL